MNQKRDDRVGININANLYLDGFSLAFLLGATGKDSLEEVLTGGVAGSDFLPVYRDVGPAFILEPLVLSNPLAEPKTSGGGFGAWGKPVGEDVNQPGNEWIPKSH